MNNSAGLGKKSGVGNPGAYAVLLFLLLTLCSEAWPAEHSLEVAASSAAGFTSSEATTPVAAATASDNEPAAVSTRAAVPVSGFKAPVGAPVPKPATGANLLSLALGLSLIVGLILALAWLVKRMGQGSLLASSHIKMLAVMPLGTRERLVIVEAGKQQLLLGITATQITTLHTFPEPVIQPEDMTHSDFGKKLLAVLHKKDNTTPASSPRRSAALDDPEEHQGKPESQL